MTKSNFEFKIGMTVANGVHGVAAAVKKNKKDTPAVEHYFPLYALNMKNVLLLERPSGAIYVAQDGCSAGTEIPVSGLTAEQAITLLKWAGKWYKEGIRQGSVDARKGVRQALRDLFGEAHMDLDSLVEEEF